MFCVNLARVDRMKDAKVEADKAIAAYKAEMEAVYQDALKKVSIGFQILYFIQHTFYNHLYFLQQQTGTAGTSGQALDATTTNDISKMGYLFNIIFYIYIYIRF